MAVLQWDGVGEKIYETGVDHGVLYTMDKTGAYSKGVAWNGLVTVTESPSGAEPNPIYADNIKYLNILSTEEFGATVECFTYPAEFNMCNGYMALGAGVNIGQQARRNFGMVYRTRIGDDVVGDQKGYKLHIIYNATASPSERAYTTVNDSPEAITFSYEVTTTPVAMTGNDADGNPYRPTASVEIDSTLVDPTVLKEIEDKLFGTTTDEPELLMPADIIALLQATP